MTVPLEIETTRLFLRTPDVNQARALTEAVRESLPEFSPWLPWAHANYDVADAAFFLNSAHDDRELEQGYAFLLFEKENLRPMGLVSLQNIEPSVPRVEIGYWLRSGACGQGLMTEAVVALCEVAVESLDAYRVEIQCDARNEKSAGVAERAGFALEGRLRNDRRDGKGNLSDTLIFARIREQNA